jgi:hypothetical protein
MQKATVIALPIKHFDLPLGEVSEQVVGLEADFFRRHFAPDPGMSE